MSSYPKIPRFPDSEPEAKSLPTPPRHPSPWPGTDPHQTNPHPRGSVLAEPGSTARATPHPDGAHERSTPSLRLDDDVPTLLDCDYRAYGVQSREGRSGVWQLRPRNEFRGARAFAHHFQRVDSISGLFVGGTLVFSAAGPALDAADLLATMNPSWSFRAVEYRIRKTTRPLRERWSTEALLARLDRAARESEGIETGRLLAEAATELRERASEIRRLRDLEASTMELRGTELRSVELRRESA